MPQLGTEKPADGCIGHHFKITKQFISEVDEETGLPVLRYDRQGDIVQATDASRIGDLHEGARKIMAGLTDEYAVTAN
jgi:sugar diacid utilization regulator